MVDLISRAALLRSLNEQAPKPTTDDLYTVNLCIINAPAVDAAPVIHGWWEVCDDCGITRCSACKWNFEGRIDYKYCPNCGAKMDGEAR